jgi:hypothetical protein
VTAKTSVLMISSSGSSPRTLISGPSFGKCRP